MSLPNETTDRVAHNSSTLITWTKFISKNATSLEVMRHSLGDLAQYLADAGPHQRKGDCPWIKLATFGNRRSEKNSLRHNANLAEIFGVEGDYDGEEITPEQAVEMLERAGVRALIYTSPSHKPEAPRWRVLAPLSKSYGPEARTALLARVNGALGGILSPESFTLSQSYFFGEVLGVEYKVFVTWNDPDEGFCVDELDELDEIAISKAAKSHPDDEPERGDYSINLFEDAVADKGRKLKTGDGRRELLKQYIASRSGKGLLRDELLTMVEGVVNKYFDPADPPDEKNLLEIVDHYVRSDRAIVSQPVDLSAFERIGMPAPVTVNAPAVLVQRSEDRLLPNYPAPFPGLMTSIVDAANAAAFKPQPQLNMLGAIIGLAGAINGEYSSPVGTRFNLYGLGVLESGGGKEMPRQMAESVAAAGKCDILGKPGSGAGLEDAIHDRRSCLVSMDEVAHVLKAVNDPKAPAHMVSIAEIVLRLYTSSRGTFNRRVLAKSPTTSKLPTVVSNPCMSLLGFSTPDGLGDAFTEGNLKDGLMGRMLFVPGDPTVLPRIPSTGIVLPYDVTQWGEALAQPDPLASKKVPLTIGSVVVQDAHGILDLRRRLILDMVTNRANGGTLGPALYARSMEKVDRISAVLAIAEDPHHPVVRLPHIEWARQFVLASDAYLLAFANQHMHSGDVTKNAAKLRAMIRKILAGEYATQRASEYDAVRAGMVSRSQLLRVSKLDKQSFDRAILHMHDLGELVGIDAKGKFLSILTDLDLT